MYVLNYFLPEQTAGTEMYVWALAKAMKLYGVDVEVIVPNLKTNDEITYDYDGIKVIKYGEPSVVNRALILGKRKPDGLYNFISCIKKSNPDIIHFHEITGSSGITIHHFQAAQKTGLKVLMTFHLAGTTCKTGTLMYKGNALCDGKMIVNKCVGCQLHNRTNLFSAGFVKMFSHFFYYLGIDTTKLNSSYGTALGSHKLMSNHIDQFKHIIASCHKVITLSDWYRKVMINNGVDENKIVCIYQGLIEQSKSNRPSIKLDLSAKLNLIFLGRISPFKGLHLLLEAVSSFSPEEISVHIFGQTTDKEYESQLKTKYAGYTNMQWKGLLNPKYVIETMGQFDILALCSTFSEMSPLVIQEAYEAGIPVVASKVYGNMEQITHNHNGLLFEFNNVDSLRSQLSRLINENTLLKTLKNNIAKPRLFDRVGEEHIALYKQVLEHVN